MMISPTATDLGSVGSNPVRISFVGTFEVPRATGTITVSQSGGPFAFNSASPSPASHCKLKLRGAEGAALLDRGKSGAGFHIVGALEFA